MKNRILRKEDLDAFHDHLTWEEKSAATIGKYLRDAEAFLTFAGVSPVTKELVMAYKQHLFGQALCSPFHQLHAGQPEQPAGFPRLGRLQGEKPENPAPDLLPGGKGNDEGGI